MTGRLVLLAPGVFAAFAAVPPDPEALRLLRGMNAAYAAVTDYDCRFIRQERVDGVLAPSEEIALAFRKPFAVRMTWVGPVHHGREALYVAGRNRDRIRAREGGWRGLITVNLDPRGRRAMTGNRHPITEVGIGHAVDVISGDVERGVERGELEIAVRPEEAVGGRPARPLELTFPGAGAYAPRQVVWIDRGFGLPTRIEVYDAGGALVERYEYSGLRLNPGLGDADFLP